MADPTQDPDPTIDTTSDTTTDQPGGQPPVAQDQDDQPLGPEGEKALQIWKQRARAAEREAKRARELEAELAKLREAQMTEQERAIENARREAAEAARTEVLRSVNERLFVAELRAATAGKLTPEAQRDLLVDPMVATKLLGFDEIPVTDTGDIDSEAISQAVASFVEARPYLAPSASRPGGADQGARPNTPSQLTREDLKNMTPEQIVEAKAAGRLDHLLGGR